LAWAYLPAPFLAPATSNDQVMNPENKWKKRAQELIKKFVTIALMNAKGKRYK
jgi:hypothetical protein